MCGRFGLGEETATIAAVIDAAVTPACADWRPRQEIFPSESSLVAIADGRGRRLGSMRWGWRRSFSSGLLINATVEGLWCNARGRPALWREALRRHRCLVPATQWFEWCGRGKAKQRHRLAAVGGELLCFAGLWERPAGAADGFFSIVTRPARPALAAVHARMPLLLDGELADRWLDPAAPATGVLEMVQAAVDDGDGPGPVCRATEDD